MRPDLEARLGSDPSSVTRAKYFLAVLLFVGLAVFGARYHWLEAAGTAERDAFVDKAELVLAGQFPRDLFRPPLYVLLMAGLAPLVGGPFVAGRVISNLAACGLALAAFGFGARLKDRQAGLWSMGLVLVNPNVWIFGEQAATNMLFACLAASAVLAGLAYLDRPSGRAALAAGVACALADWVRGNATTLVPALFLAYLLAPRRPAAHGPGAGRAPAHLALALGGAVVVMAPLWWLRWRYFGSPFHDENWRNLWWKLHAHSDWSLLESGGPRSSFGRLILGEPLAVGASALRELANFFVRTLPALVGGWWCLPPLVVAVVGATRGRSPGALYLLFALGTFTFGVAAVFFTWDRFMLVWIPVAAALSIAECHRVAGRWRPTGGLPPWGATVSALLIVLTFTSTVGWKLPSFVRQHPYSEVAALAPKDREIGPDESLAGTAPFLQRYFRHRYVHLPDDTGLHGVDDYHDWCAVERLLRAARVRYVAVSDVELRQRPRSLLGGEGTPPAPGWLELVRRDAHNALWRVRDSARSPENAAVLCR